VTTTRVVCAACQRSFQPVHRNCAYCSDERRRWRIRTRVCVNCQQSFQPVHGNCKYCSDECRLAKAPAVYRFVCPDGRSYVGAVADIRKREIYGIHRSNPWLEAAFERYPPDTFTYEILERLPPGCSRQQLREAEQRHIERFRSWDPERGFNIWPATWDGDGPGVLAARQRRADQTRNNNKNIWRLTD
jgi:hypothetical protein